MLIKEFTKGKDDNVKISDNFTAKEFACHCNRCSTYKVDVEYVQDVIQSIRVWADAPVSITSGYRCLEHNTEVGGASSSNHMKGTAFDIQVTGKTPHEVAKHLEALGVKGIIEYANFVHTDDISYKRYATTFNGDYKAVDTFFDVGEVLTDPVEEEVREAGTIIILLEELAVANNKLEEIKKILEQED